ncbi:MAG TPA: DUF4124 domain-containing protein, partial [Propylenella sp.]|nr:DUF4124 domain-containing protein [Propylenella sp.]
MTGFKLFACLLGLTSMAASAAVYRWVDEDGHVHYTDKAVVNSEVINVRTGTPKDASGNPVPAADPTLTQDQLTRKKADCEQKKQQYESYRTAIK